MRSGLYPDGCTAKDIDEAYGFSGAPPLPDCLDEESRPAIYGESQIHYDGGDVSDTRGWYGEAISCIACKETSRLRLGFTPTYLLLELFADGCGCPMVWVDELRDGVRL